MSDEDLRELERRVRTGDTTARPGLVRLRERTSPPRLWLFYDLPGPRNGRSLHLLHPSRDDFRLLREPALRWRNSGITEHAPVTRCGWSVGGGLGALTRMRWRVLEGSTRCEKCLSRVTVGPVQYNKTQSPGLWQLHVAYGAEPLANVPCPDPRLEEIEDALAEVNRYMTRFYARLRMPDLDTICYTKFPLTLGGPPRGGGDCLG